MERACSRAVPPFQGLWVISTMLTQAYAALQPGLLYYALSGLRAIYMFRARCVLAGCCVAKEIVVSTTDGRVAVLAVFIIVFDNNNFFLILLKLF